MSAEALYAIAGVLTGVALALGLPSLYARVLDLISPAPPESPVPVGVRLSPYRVGIEAGGLDESGGDESSDDPLSTLTLATPPPDESLTWWEVGSEADGPMAGGPIRPEHGGERWEDTLSESPPWPSTPTWSAPDPDGAPPHAVPPRPDPPRHLVAELLRRRGPE